MVTLKDIAKRAGVSSITVSRVANRSGYVGAATRERVQAAISELGYVPNQVASSLRSRRSDLLALVLPDITNSFWTTIARGVEDEAWAHGYSVFICNTDNDPEKEAAYVESLLRRRVDGVLIVTTPDPGSERQLERLHRQGMKFVVIHRTLRAPIADVVRSDAEGATRALTAALLQAGSRRIGYVGLPSSHPGSERRLIGFHEAMASAGRETDPELIRIGARDPADGYRMVTELLVGPVRPDAILLANSRLAIGGVRAITHAGLTIPDDIGVAAFHDTSALDDYAPSLIRAVQPSYAMGQQATKMLLERTDRVDGEYREMVLPPRIFLPGSESPEPVDSSDRERAGEGADAPNVVARAVKAS